jgi:PAS domain S-box-containing protein
MKILIADDNQQNLYLLETILKSGGYEVVSVNNGVEALDRLLKEPIDLIISDILMPKMDGFQLCLKCKDNERLKNIPFIMTTATYTEKSDENFCLQLGAGKVMVWPIGSDDLLKTIKEVLEKAHKEGLVGFQKLDQSSVEFLKGYNERIVRQLEMKMTELQESKTLFETVVENIPLMIFLKEATDLRFVIFNRAGEELLGYDRKDLLGKNDRDFFPPEQADNFIAKDREVLAGEAGKVDIPEEPIDTAKKGRRILHTQKVCIRDADGKTKFLLGISEDITERKRAEGELKKKVNDLEIFYKSAMDREDKIIELKKKIDELKKTKGPEEK